MHDMPYMLSAALPWGYIWLPGQHVTLNGEEKGIFWNQNMGGFSRISAHF
jgi:hypothetical protein